ncbi:MAG TPA: 50S ribosomal protein L11 methyltransferase [Aliidongia sp.]|nr:50S ribosomal protein L11 methyltransferase [Aliidongia sp.]
MTPLRDGAAFGFIAENTLVASPSLLPELKLQLASEITPIWQASEIALEQANVPPPFWAFAWAGGQALARHVLDSPRTRWANRRVLDFGAGSGLVGIAAAKAGARLVRAAEIDPVACAAIRLNAKLNDVEIEVVEEDVIDRDPAVDIILVGDMCYERPLAERLVAWLRPLAGRGVEVLMGDPGRTYRPTHGLVEVARYTVPTSLDLEDRETREGIVWKLLP